MNAINQWPVFGSIDMHCDTISRLHRCGDAVHIFENDLQVDIQKLRVAGAAAQFFAVFMPVAKIANPLITGMEMIDRFYREIELNSDLLAFAGSSGDLARNTSEGKISAFLTIEDSGIIDGNPALLRLMHRLGVRLITLTWNSRNRVGYPNVSEEESREGLSENGITFIHEMERLGMLIDVSHLSDAGFYDVCREIRGPFVASHSNAREITSHTRNLTDDMIRKIAEHGGVIGVNFYSLFVEPYILDNLYTIRDGYHSQIEHVVRHIRHLINIGGIDSVGLGTDYDGIDSVPEGLENASRLPALFEALGKAGLRENAIDKIRYGNVLRVIRDVCG